MFNRLCNIPKKQSFFLFGARGTGKTSLLRSTIPKDRTLWIDLLDREVEDRYAANPGLLYAECSSRNFEWVVIDEIQKLPALLDTVHRIIENPDFKSPKFSLTGSSARKLRSGGANLLAGRAFVRNLFPLTHTELGESFDLERILNYGSLPRIFSFTNDADCNDFLVSYGLTYLKEEVWAEHLIQNLDSFRKFLEIAAQSNGKIVNYANISRDVNAHEKTVKKYFQILEDTLLGFVLEPYHHSVRKRQSKSPKFYLFDLGIKRALARSLRQQIVPGTYAYGEAFEHFIIAEAVRLNDYHKRDFQFSYLLTKDMGEIDLIADRPGQGPALIEIKSSTRTHSSDTAYLKSIRKDFEKSDAYCLSLDPHERKEDGIIYLPWQKGMMEIGL